MREATTKQLLLKTLHRFTYFVSTATCQSGYGAVCKTVYPGSIPGVASKKQRLSNAAKLPRFSSLSPAVRSVASSLCYCADRRVPPVWDSCRSTSVTRGACD
jgi:hypothetical protein